MLSRRTAATLALTATVLWPAGFAPAKPGGRPGTQGNYILRFIGDYQGDGQAKINPAHLNVDATLTAGDGASVILKIKNLKVDNGKFDGPATLNGQSATVSGRVDGPEGGIVTVARLSFIVKNAAGKACRGFGEMDTK